MSDAVVKADALAVKPEAKPEKPTVPPIVIAERARFRFLVESAVADMRKAIRSGTYPTDVPGVLGRMILTKLEAVEPVKDASS